MIEQAQITLLTIASAVTILLPIIIAIIWIIKSKSYVYPLFIGALIFLVFALVLESTMHTIVFSVFPFVGNNTFLYIIYGCLAASIFEEGGRYIAFRYLMKNTYDKKCAVTFGIGHGGFEMITVVGMTMISTLMFALTYNSLGLDGMLAGSNDPELYNMITEMVASINTYDVQAVILSVLERVSAIMIHVSCSIFVFKSVQRKDLRSLGIAFGLHALMNIPAGLYQRQVINNLWIVEIFILIFACIGSYFAYTTYKKMDCE